MHWSVAASAISLYNPDIDVVLDVDNRADVVAPASVATVVFKVNGASQSVSQPVAPVPAHGTSRATFRVPKGCFDPVAHRCYHTVTADSANQVPESNEANNTDSGYKLLANVSGITNPPTAQARSVTQVRQVKVTAQTLAELRAGKNYVADLSRAGVVYEFNPAAGAIDFKRVVVHTALGNQALGPWLEKTFSNRGLTGWDSKGFRIAAAADLRKLPPTSPNPPPKTPATIITCDPGNSCKCHSKEECDFLLWFLDCAWTVCTLDQSECRCGLDPTAPRRL
jgi:hypothetical protein